MDTVEAVQRLTTTSATDRWDWSGVRIRCLREARRVLRDPHDAEEAAQEALARAWRQRAACRSADAPDAWLVRIAHHEALRVLERRRRRSSYELDGDASPALSAPADELSVALDGVAYRERLASLAPQDRLIVHLRYGEDRSQPEIARMVGLPEGTVKIRLHRARARLRRQSDGSTALAERPSGRMNEAA